MMQGLYRTKGNNVILLVNLKKICSRDTPLLTVVDLVIWCLLQTRPAQMTIHAINSSDFLKIFTGRGFSRRLQFWSLCVEIKQKEELGKENSTTIALNQYHSETCFYC